MLVISDHHAGSVLAGDLAGDTDVHLVTDCEQVATQAPETVRVTVGDVSSSETLEAAADAVAAVVALSRDRTAVLVTQLLRTQFDITDIVAVVNDPQRHVAFDGLATTVCGSSALATTLAQATETAFPTHESPAG
jgi:Trk K+ transport system NAD-binding subunit